MKTFVRVMVIEPITACNLPMARAFTGCRAEPPPRLSPSSAAVALRDIQRLPSAAPCPLFLIPGRQRQNLASVTDYSVRRASAPRRSQYLSDFCKGFVKFDGLGYRQSQARRPGGPPAASLSPKYLVSCKKWNY